jgi:hypothetical protein
MSLGTSILNAFAQALSLVFTFVPKLIGFLILLLVGWLIATALKKAVTLVLRKIGFDRLGERIGLSRLEQQMGLKLDAAGLLGQIVYWFVFLIFLVPACDALGLTAVSGILNSLIAFIPNVFVAVIVLFLGVLAANFVARLVRGATAGANIGNANIFANIARFAILGFVAIIALEQLQIAPSLLNILFTAVIGAVAVAFALAFGLGGQDAARRLLARSEQVMTTNTPQLNTQESQLSGPTATQFRPTTFPQQ